MRTTKNRFVLMDRDGVINRHIEGGYVTCWEEFEFLPWSLQGLRLLAEHGFEVLVASNQACVGKGLVAEGELHRITKRFVAEVEAAGGGIREVYYCTHRADQHCSCRKPQVGLLLKAQAEHDFHFADTFMIGDSPSDIKAAFEVGAPAVLVSSRERGGEAAGFDCKKVSSLYEAAELIVASTYDAVYVNPGHAARATR